MPASCRRRRVRPGVGGVHPDHQSGMTFLTTPETLRNPVDNLTWEFRYRKRVYRATTIKGHVPRCRHAMHRSGFISTSFAPKWTTNRGRVAWYT